MGRSKESGGLGYCDLECFNLALLAKQGWRLIQHPDYLVATIFKEKYYPNSTFLDTPLGNKPSYAWRSIWNAKPLLKEGMVWWVGDGHSISIWGDKWLLVNSTHAVQSPIRLLEGHSKVCELIDNTTMWWSTPLVEAIFNEEEANIICGLSIILSTQADQMIWGAAKNEKFTVRRAYHVAMDVGVRYFGASSTDGPTNSLWKRTWRIRGPRVVRMFMWQACSNILPTNENLLKRKVLPNPLCPICRREAETVGHALWSCPAAQDVWHGCRRKIQKSATDEMSFQDIFEGLLTC